MRFVHAFNAERSLQFMGYYDDVGDIFERVRISSVCWWEWKAEILRCHLGISRYSCNLVSQFNYSASRYNCVIHSLYLYSRLFSFSNEIQLLRDQSRIPYIGHHSCWSSDQSYDVTILIKHGSGIRQLVLIHFLSSSSVWGSCRETLGIFSSLVMFPIAKTFTKSGIRLCFAKTHSCGVGQLLSLKEIVLMKVCLVYG